MFGDLLELATTLIHPDHEPDIGASSSTTADHDPNATMPPRRSHSKSQSLSSVTADANGMPPPATPASASKSSTPARKRRSRSTTSPPATPVVATTPKVLVTSPTGVEKQVNKAHLIQQKSSIPSGFKFLIVLILTTALEALLQTVASQFGTGDLATISKHVESWEEVSGLLGWKVLQLGVYWFSGYDAYDVAAVTLLLSTPSTLLLALFYQIRPSTLIATTAASIASISIPWALLRPLSPSHNPSSAPKSALKNRPILTDPYTTVATSILATAIFAVLLEISFATFLPSWLVVNFTGLRTLEAIYLGAQGLPALLLALLPAGYAAMEFLFAPSTAAIPTTVPLVTALDPITSVFDPATASFMSHVRYNAWGWYSSRQKSLIKRTTVLAVLIVAETVVQVWGTINGVELQGALGYAAVWGVGVLILGGVLDWVGGPSD